MKRASLIAAGGIVVLANVLALAHAARNRAGTDAEITLRQREARYFAHAASAEDSGVSLSLAWTDLANYAWVAPNDEAVNWLNRDRLMALGFDCSMDPRNPDSALFYQRQRPRSGFVALEYEGPAWRRWLELEQARAQQKGGIGAEDVSHLVPIDADRDAAKLRVRHPDRSSVIVTPAVIAIRTNWYPGAKVEPKGGWRLSGYLQELPSWIHVPQPFSEAFRAHPASYRVRVRWGALLEPWITGVDTSAPPTF